MRNIAIFFLCIIFITGCATTTTFNIPEGQPLEKTTVIRDYTIGEEKSVSTGSVMIEKKKGIQQYILSVTSARGAIVGTYEFSLWNISSGINFNSPVRLIDTAQLEAVNDYKEGEGEPVVFRITGLDLWYGRYPVKGESVPTSELIIKKQIAEAGGLMYQLLYNGKKGDNTIGLTYREFSNSFARPAFYQDLSYDLNESSLISFKEYTIRILKATNNEISFIVEKE